jgi:hypothetical protein
VFDQLADLQHLPFFALRVGPQASCFVALSLVSQRIVWSRCHLIALSFRELLISFFRG